MQVTKKMVEVGVDQKGWKFPVMHPTITNDNGDEFYQIPVDYVEVETLDELKADETFKQLAAAQGGTLKDVLKAINAGLRLAQGDNAKEPFKAESGKKLLPKALSWAPVEVLVEYKTVQAQKGSDEANIWLVGQYKAAVL